MAEIDFIRSDLQNKFEEYDKISDCIAGEVAVKKRREIYLPKPNPEDTSQANTTRYESYLTRAVFYNVTGHTLTGMVGQIFSRDPVIEVPELVKIVEKDADGSGIDLEQTAKKTATETLSKGRCGILVDYPLRDQATTRREMLNGDVRPTIVVYDAKSIINWRQYKRSGKIYLSLVVIRETYMDEADEFETKEAIQFRELRLIDGVYNVRIWRKVNGSSTYQIVSELSGIPRDGKGNPITEIPFTFVGSDNNSPSIDPCPFYGIASLNLAHYRNSADYEESVFLVGQPTPYATGLTEDWVNNVLGNSIALGSRFTLPLPPNSSVGLIQAEANGLAFEAMQHKERQMVALGAKLVEQQAVQRTATEARQENASETSVLSNVAKNVEKAIKWALEWCAIFTGEIGFDDDARNTSIKYELNTEFDLTQLTAEQQREVIAAWQSNAITFGEMRAVLRRGGMATLPDDKALAAIQEEVTLMANAIGSNDETDNEDEDENEDEENNTPTNNEGE